MYPICPVDGASQAPCYGKIFVKAGAWCTGCRWSFCRHCHRGVCFLALSSWVEVGKPPRRPVCSSGQRTQGRCAGGREGGLRGFSFGACEPRGVQPQGSGCFWVVVPGPAPVSHRTHADCWVDCRLPGWFPPLVQLPPSSPPGRLLLKSCY